MPTGLKHKSTPPRRTPRIRALSKSQEVSSSEDGRRRVAQNELKGCSRVIARGFLICLMKGGEFLFNTYESVGQLKQRCVLFPPCQRCPIRSEGSQVYVKHSSHAGGPVETAECRRVRITSQQADGMAKPKLACSYFPYDKHTAATNMGTGFKVILQLPKKVCFEALVRGIYWWFLVGLHTAHHRTPKRSCKDRFKKQTPDKMTGFRSFPFTRAPHSGVIIFFPRGVHGGRCRGGGSGWDCPWKGEARSVVFAGFEGTKTKQPQVLE